MMGLGLMLPGGFVTGGAWEHLPVIDALSLTGANCDVDWYRACRLTGEWRGRYWRGAWEVRAVLHDGAAQRVEQVLVRGVEVKPPPPVLVMR